MYRCGGPVVRRPHLKQGSRGINLPSRQTKDVKIGNRCFLAWLSPLRGLVGMVSWYCDWAGYRCSGSLWHGIPVRQCYVVTPVISVTSKHRHDSRYDWKNVESDVKHQSLTMYHADFYLKREKNIFYIGVAPICMKSLSKVQQYQWRYIYTEARHVHGLSLRRQRDAVNKKHDRLSILLTVYRFGLSSKCYMKGVSAW